MEEGIVAEIVVLIILIVGILYSINCEESEVYKVKNINNDIYIVKEESKKILDN